jgi:hypothetical protein
MYICLLSYTILGQPAIQYHLKWEFCIPFMDYTQLQYDAHMDWFPPSLPKIFKKHFLQYMPGRLLFFLKWTTLYLSGLSHEKW